MREELSESLLQEVPTSGTLRFGLVQQHAGNDRVLPKLIGEAVECIVELLSSSMVFLIFQERHLPPAIRGGES